MLARASGRQLAEKLCGHRVIIRVSQGCTHEQALLRPFAARIHLAENVEGRQGVLRVVLGAVEIAGPPQGLGTLRVSGCWVASAAYFWIAPGTSPLRNNVRPCSSQASPNAGSVG